MGRHARMVAVMALLAPAAVVAQATADVHEVPLRVEDGRLVVSARTAAGAEVDFVLGLAETRLSAWGADAMGLHGSEVMLGDVAVSLEGVPTVPDDGLLLDAGSSGHRFGGVIGGRSLSRYDVLVDAPGGRLLLKRPGRFVRWDGVTLTNATPIQILHEYLIRTEVAVNGVVYSAHLELTPATMLVSNVVESGAAVTGGRADFRLGYSAYPALPARNPDLAELRGWGGDDIGVVFVGAPIALDCALAISWVHAELRTCVR